MINIDNMINSVVIHDASQQHWLHFCNPRRIVLAHRIEEVIPALNIIENTVNKHGFYAAGFIAYEAAPAFDPALVVKKNGSFPLLWFGIYSQPEELRFPTAKKGCPDHGMLSLKSKRILKKAIPIRSISPIA